MSFIIFILISNFIVSPISPVQSTNVKKSTSSSITNIKSSILEWWKNNNEPKPFGCNFKIETAKNNTFLHTITAPEVKTFPCTNSSKSPSRFHFKGKIKDGYLEGKGRLTLINGQQWKKLAPHKKEEIIQQNICLIATRTNLLEKNVVDIIGNFKKGLLHGKAKLSYDGESFSIASYKNGKLHGYQRIFDPNGTLVEAGVFNAGWPSGYHWKMEFGNLIFYDTSMIVEHLNPSLVFPISNEGALGDPMAGNYNPYSGALDNIHQTLISGISYNASDCILNVEFQLLEKVSYSYSVFSKTKIPFFGHNHTLLCDIVPKNKNSTPASKLNDWFDAIDEMEDPYRNSFQSDGIHSHKRAHEILWRLKPLKEEPDHKHSRKLISDVNIDNENRNMTARIFGSPPLQIKIVGGQVTLDGDNRPHGFNDFQVINDHQKFVPRDDTLGWAPKRIIGFFQHGSLNGITGIATNRSTLIWGMVKDGVLHGPTITYGISFIMEEVSKST